MSGKSTKNGRRKKVLKITCIVFLELEYLFASSGISILEIKSLKTLNMLPALLVPPVWFIIMWIISLL